MLALAAFGLRKSFLLFFRFPGAILLPMFTPFTFGPVTANNCDCKLTKSPMELSFKFTYINIVISAIGGATCILVADIGEGAIFALILPSFVCQLIFIGIFHLFEKKCLCCCNFCFPFTKRETVDIGDTPVVRIEGEAIDLKNLGKGGLILQSIYFQFQV